MEPQELIAEPKGAHHLGQQVSHCSLQISVPLSTNGHADSQAQAPQIQTPRSMEELENAYWLPGGLTEGHHEITIPFV